MSLRVRTIAECVIKLARWTNVVDHEDYAIASYDKGQILRGFKTDGGYVVTVDADDDYDKSFTFIVPLAYADEIQEIGG